jgi:hypothetical protein
VTDEEKRDPYHDGIRDALEEVRLLVDDLPDGPHVFELEAKIDQLEQRMTSATEPPDHDDTISVRIGKRATQGLGAMLSSGLGSTLFQSVANGLAMHSLMREGERWAMDRKNPCAKCSHGQLRHELHSIGPFRRRCTAKDCDCTEHVPK